jgi:signal peptidase I
MTLLRQGFKDEAVHPDYPENCLDNGVYFSSRLFLIIDVMDYNKISELLRDSLGKYDHVWIRLVGKSMLPFLKSKTLIAGRKVDIKDIHIGDIVLFKKGDIPIAHRVFKKVNSGGRIFLQAKSDTSFFSEPLISYEEIVGKVVAFKRFKTEIKIDNFIFRLLGLGAGLLFPFIVIARAHFTFKSVTNNAVQG